jgi:Icc-related predicted phosphoesterase
MGVKEKGGGVEVLTNATHVLDGTSAEIMGIKIFGSPVSPVIPGINRMAFNVERGEKGAKQVWDQVEAGTDVVLSHSPPFSKLDRTFFGSRVGCEQVAAMCARVKPRFVVFGHIHEGYGVVEEEGTVYVNASSVTLLRKCLHEPVVFDIVPKSATRDLD